MHIFSLFNCATNQQLQPKEGKETWAGEIPPTESMCTSTGKTLSRLDLFYLQKIHGEVSSMGKSTVCSLLWHSFCTMTRAGGHGRKDRGKEVQSDGCKVAEPKRVRLGHIVFSK